MRHPSFVVLACVWLALCGLALLRPTYGTALREAEGAGRVDSAASPAQDAPPAAFLQMALLALSPSSCDEEIVAAGEMPLHAGQRAICHLTWFRRAFANDFTVLAAFVQDRDSDGGESFWIAERQRELGIDFPWGQVSASLRTTPQLTANGVKLDGAVITGHSWLRRGSRSSWDSWREPGVERGSQRDGGEIALSFDRPRLLLHDETGFAVLLRATRSPAGREPLERLATWRTFLTSWLSPAAANERDLVAEQLALAGLVLRDAPLLAAARSAPLPPPLADDADGWRRFARRALAIARGSLEPDGALDPFGCEPALAVRALRTGPAGALDAESERQLVAGLRAELRDVPLAGLLAAGAAPLTPSVAALRDAAIEAATPDWMRRVPWCLPGLLVLGAVGLWLFVQRPQVGAVRPLGLGGMFVLALTMLVEGWPFDTWARAALLALLCLPRWRAMDRLWRVVAGLALFATAVGLVLPFRLLPWNPPWSNLPTLTTAGTWLLALGVVLGDSRWRAPQLLAAVVALHFVPIAAFFVPSLAPVGLLVIRLGAAYTITVLLLELLFFCLWRRQPRHAGRIDEPPLAAAQPA